jgi:hypothetical protein
MLDLSGVSDWAILATIEKYEGILAGTRPSLWAVEDCAICMEGEMDCGECCLVEDGWCENGSSKSKLYPYGRDFDEYKIDVREFLELVEAERLRREL